MQRQPDGNPIWSAVGMPAVKWLSLSGILVMLSLLLSGEIVPPKLLDEPDPGPGAGQSGSNPFDLGALRERLPPEALAQVERYIAYYRNDRRRGFRDALARSTRYIETYQRMFEEKGLPRELAFLPLIESGFMETAVSPARAVGVWQFIEETGRRYNLKSSPWFDEKRDPIESSRAAATYLGHLFEEFQDWELALAAYNSGSGTVRWAVKSNRKAKLPTGFWDLDLPDETRTYVPAFLAAMLIAKNPVAFGFKQIKFHPQMVFEQIKVNPGIHLADLAAHLDTDLKALQELNPALLTSVTPPGKKPYILRIPRGMRDDLARNLIGQSVSHADWVVHRVRSSDTLQRLASRFRSDANLIMKTNGLRSNSDLRPGRFVIIPL